MKIFVIPSGYRSSNNPQHDIFVHDQCKALLDRGHKVIVLDANIRSPKSWMNKYCCSPHKRYEEGVTVYSYWTRGVPTVKFPRLSLFLYEKRMRYLWKYVLKFEGMPDVIYSHFTFPSGYIATKISKETGIPNITLEHGSIFFKEYLRPYLKKVASFTIKNATDFYCVSTSQVEAVCRHIGENVSIKTIPNMISNIFTYHPVTPSDDFVFFSAGNLKQIKRFDVLIKAFANSFKDVPNVKLRIAGEGEEREHLQNIISSLGCEDKIIMLGRLSREQILEELKNCNVFALASDHESFGIVYREATACGRPIISTQNGGIVEGWNDSLGITVPCGDVSKFSEALLYIKKHYEDFSPEKISELTLSYCSEKVIIDKIENILFNAAGKNNAE